MLSETKHLLIRIMSPKAQNSRLNLGKADNIDFAGIAEAHLLEDNLYKRLDVMRLAGSTPTAAPARHSAKSENGTNVAVICMTTKGLATLSPRGSGKLGYNVTDDPRLTHTVAKLRG